MEGDFIGLDLFLQRFGLFFGPDHQHLYLAHFLDNDLILIGIEVGFDFLFSRIP